MACTCYGERSAHKEIAMEKEIAVSVVCDAYNHEKYIAQCLDGIVMQKTSFAFEVLVHDDASTDKTADIIREYEKKYPELIKPVYQTVNQYTRGGTEQFQYPRVKGKYIAMCEGDDYWTDPMKLQKQYDAMEANPHVDICTHRAIQWDERQGKILQYIAPRDADGVIPVEDVILGGGGYVATNSILYRAELERNRPPFRQMTYMDYFVQIQGSLRGGMLYLDDCMSVYRFMTAGSWTQTTRKDPAKVLAHLEEVEKIMEQLDLDTGGQYSEVIRKTLLNRRFREYKCINHCKELLKPQYRPFLQEMSRSERLRIYAKACFPVLGEVRSMMQKIRR